MIFAKNSADGGKAWHSDQDRVKWKKRYLDTMSCIFARHRARDLTLLVKWKVHEIHVYVPRVIDLGIACFHSLLKFCYVKY
jgi:hypothetical protein